MASVVKNILKDVTSLPPILNKAPERRRAANNLYAALRFLPKNGLGVRVTQKRLNKVIRSSYYEITRVKLKGDDLTHGKVWGVKHCRGKAAEKEERIRGGLKHSWVVLGHQAAISESLVPSLGVKAEGALEPAE